ncbi:hypothetical protein Pcinc_026868 [Petrolisthes cinctipes]|uniref:Uncharacterized protein n=1 Tax=Petrolisthes cinctipes TaxID=88211 RepID=A0AAE1KB21_PETCI|nr:hypothetical protein Pcinc_026868 [Petrolisthes cinctipes]
MSLSHLSDLARWLAVVLTWPAVCFTYPQAPSPTHQPTPKPPALPIHSQTTCLTHPLPSLLPYPSTPKPPALPSHSQASCLTHPLPSLLPYTPTPKPPVPTFPSSDLILASGSDPGVSRKLLCEVIT